MATPSDVSRDAQVVALALARGESADEINARLDRLGISIGSQRWTRALNSGSLAYEFGRAVNAQDWGTAELQLAQMRGMGVEGIAVLARMVSWPQGHPVDQSGQPEYAYRRFKDVLPIGMSAEEIAAWAVGFAQGLAGSRDMDTPGYGDYITTVFEFGAPQ